MKPVMFLMFLVAIAATFALAAGCSERASVEGKGGSKLTLVQPDAVTLERGGLARTDVQIKRQNLAGEVSIRFTDLPRGVTIVDSGSKIVGDEGTYTLKASETADLVENHSATVTATAGPGDIAVSQPIIINVKERKQ